MKCLYTNCISIVLLALLWGCASTSHKVMAPQDTPAHRDSSDIQSNSIQEPKQQARSDTMTSDTVGLSRAAQFMINACNNYIEVNPKSQKIPEVLGLKATVYYNKKMFEQSRSIYQQIIAAYPKSPEAVDAVRITAQSYYEENNYERAQEWYRKLKEMAKEGTNKNEAVNRIAESIFRLAEKCEKDQQYMKAAGYYEQVALEFPDAAIADISLYNAGQSYEKATEWSRAILMCERLKKNYPSSKLLYKAFFRSAKSYEKLTQWDDAAQTYLRLVANFPACDLVSASLYNAGFCFENGKKYLEAGSTFEKLALSFPNSNDAADILFKAGELFGQIKDWQSVTRVTQEFLKKYGGDKNRKIQAECMFGVALLMQGDKKNALTQLKKAVFMLDSIKSPSTANVYYAAKAQFTIGEILHGFQNEIKLVQPQQVYTLRLKEKSDYLEKAVEAFSKVLKYGISEWFVQAINQIASSYEDFAIDLFNQERPNFSDMEKRLALELGIAQAVDQYLIDQALHYYEQNVKIGLKEKIENQFILTAREKLTSLPYVAGQNYLNLSAITEKMNIQAKAEGFKLIAAKLQLLQKIAPFQERAIALFLKTLELGSTYQIQNEFYKKASALITQTSFTVGKTYEDVALIARNAPIPATFDSYEKFVYKSKLLSQIESYEENALSNYSKVVKIAQAYSLQDPFIEKARNQIATVLFNRGRCYDLLCNDAFNNPPFPAKITDAEKDEYRAQFQEVGLKYQQHAYDIYKLILDYTRDGFASGEYVNHAYVRLYQNSPQDYGIKTEKTETKIFTSGPQWKCSSDSSENWYSLDFNDADWKKPTKEELPPTLVIKGFPEKVPIPMWCNDSTQHHASMAFFRLGFYVKDMIYEGKIYLSAINTFTAYFNGAPLKIDSVKVIPIIQAAVWDVTKNIRQGKNVIAIKVTNGTGTSYGVMPYLVFTLGAHEYLPRLPGEQEIIDKKKISPDVYKIPEIVNFSSGK